MILIKPESWFDLNKLALGLLIVMAVIVLFYPIKIFFIIILELIFLSLVFFFLKKIKQHQSISILLNDEGKWFIQRTGETQNNNSQMQAVELKDYWIIANKLCFWLKGSNISLALVLSRRIIGATNYSKIRSMLI
ncbi:MAG TPA: hypothetical protein ENJ44_02480 [Oceanospirillales bacterium]|nr:hypothetical protein [Oceanospirillales bacterium]